MYQHHYQPLDTKRKQIRVLDVEPAKKFEAAIHCSMRVVSLDKIVDYEALSYTWGKPEPKREIMLDGTKFSAQENLEAALRRLRYSSKKRTLWVDAICINQTDTTEKNIQVARMGDIYTHARQVVAWLGEPDEDINLGARSLAATGMWGRARATQLAERSLKGHDLMSSPTGDSWSAHSIGRRSYSDDVELGEIARLMDRPYFTRCWIQQEIVLAKKLVVVCGATELDWSNIKSRLSKNDLRSRWKTNARPLRVLDQAVVVGDYKVPEDELTLLDGMRNARENGTQSSIYKLLFNNRRLGCTNARDRVFAFMSLVEERDKRAVIIDYSNSVEQVYTNTARALMQAHGTLDILNCTREPAPGDNRTSDVIHSLLDQGRFVDPRGKIVGKSNGSTRRGWVRLPLGWERQVTLKPARETDASMRGSCMFVNHKTGQCQERSPVKDQPAAQPLIDEEWKRLPPGWIKDWDNTGRLCLQFGTKNNFDQMEKSGSRNLELPTWVPNWKHYSVRDPELLASFSSSSPSHWAGGKDQKIALMKDGNVGDTNILMLRGLTFDTVAEIGNPWYLEIGVIPVSRIGIHVLEQWEDLAMNTDAPCPYVTAKARKNALWRTHVADHAGDGGLDVKDEELFEAWCNRPDPRFPSFPPWAPDAPAVLASEKDSHVGMDELKALVTLQGYLSLTSTYPDESWEKVQSLSTGKKIKKTARILGDAYSDFFLEMGKHTARYREFRARLIKTCRNRAMFVTKKGYIGLAPWNARLGDRVCVFRGGATPFLLRPAVITGVPGRTFNLVGETYVYGIMAGEAFEKQRSGQLEQYKIV